METQFHDIQFPPSISFGVTGGPTRSTSITKLANGYEIRNTRQKFSKRKYMAGSGVKSTKALYEIIAFFEARQGSIFGFRWKDWTDYKSSNPSSSIEYKDQQIGIGDDVTKTFQLKKFYYSGDKLSERRITKPVAATVRVGVSDWECVRGKDFDLNALTGEVSFQKAPEAGAPIYAGFEFDVPVRFDCDELLINLEHFQAGAIPNIPVVEIFE